jgi:hypothetical protein
MALVPIAPPLQVHGAPAAPAVPVGEPADLGERPAQHGADVVGQFWQHTGFLRHDVAEGLGEELVVTAVRAVDEVVAAQREDGTDRAALLADARVCGAVDQALAGQFEHVLLERPDPERLAHHPQQQIGIGGVPVVGRGLQLDPRRAGGQVLTGGHQCSSKKIGSPQWIHIAALP